MKDNKKKSTLSYEDSGVSISKGDAFVETIKPFASQTTRPGHIGGIGGFGGLFDISALDYREPIIVATTDGVGTKLLLALEEAKHDEIGIDLVAMCVNDLVVQGAEPLFFLDYLSVGALKPEVATSILKGIANGCHIAGATLLGGETAEMPGLYTKGHYDLAGFAVGIVEKRKIIDGKDITKGDVVLGLASSGIHSNGFSLFRKVRELNLDAKSKPSNEEALRPTKIYVKSILAAIKEYQVNGISHITGGGLTNNIPRIMPKGLCAKINLDSWLVPEIFTWLAEAGPIKETEMLRTFNCGIGMVLIVPPDEAQGISKKLTYEGEKVFQIGEIVSENKAIVYSGRAFS